MAFVWVQQWWALPVILEEPQMADGNARGGRLPVERMAARVSDDEVQPMSATSHAPYQLHLQAPTSQQRSADGQPFSMPGPRSNLPNAPQGPMGGPFNMGSMTGALPDYQAQSQSHGAPHHQQRFPSVSSSPALVHQLQNISQFAGQTPIPSPGYNVSFSSQYPTPFPPNQQGMQSSQMYSQHQQAPISRSGGPSPIQVPQFTPSYFPGHQQQFMYYPGPYGPLNPAQQNLQGQPRQNEGVINMMSGSFPGHSSYAPSVPIAYGQGVSGPYLRPGSVPTVSRQSSGSSPGSIPSTPRGPPRKPKQSGHALWVGNLPPGTLVTDLKDHFSREATNNIESVFLISKSNCAFVNYRTEVACAAAMTRFHDSRFQGVRLVCRLRRNPSSPASGVPTGPAALAPAFNQAQSATEAIAQNREVSSKAEEASQNVDGTAKVTDKYFVLKSLTVEDLELSARNGIWATQAHNEVALNEAFDTAENVYLVFSANKSGEYFGYARMASPINDDAAANLEWAPRAEAASDDTGLPRSIPTTATEFAPKGRIIDDSARGTIFWEADPEDQGIPTLADEDDTKSNKSVEEGEEAAVDPPSGAQAFGKPFKIEWLSTNRLPFYRTRGLRNPWNANREVKIARDGTELETSVGRRLVQMFHRSVPSPGPLPAGGAMLGMPAQMGYPPMRHY